MGLEHFNPLLNTHRLVMALKRDRGLREEFKADERKVLERFDLTSEERSAIQTRDFRALYELGVHQYLLSQLARLIFGTAEGTGTSEAASALMRSLLGEEAEKYLAGT